MGLPFFEGHPDDILLGLGHGSLGGSCFGNPPVNFDNDEGFLSFFGHPGADETAIATSHTVGIPSATQFPDTTFDEGYFFWSALPNNHS
jgi:hypothetical protein